jgi:hypothetical protein
MTERHKFFIGLFILFLGTGFSLWQLTALRANQVNIDRFNTESANLRLLRSNLDEQYQGIKVDVIDGRDSLEQSINLVFPRDEDLTKLTRMFDDFAVRNNFSSNPFFISNLSYSNPQTDENSSYSYVPVNLNFTTSKKNLNKFLEFIETSGSLEAGTRLMSVEDMTMSYPKEYGGTYSVRMSLAAYFTYQEDGE